MKLDFRYLGRSGVTSGASGNTLSFSPNLARPKVFFDGQLLYPVRFREAMSALHDVVVGDLRFKKRDKSAYEAYKKQKAREEVELRATLMDRAKVDELKRISKEPLPPNLGREFQKLRDQYWDARRRWSNELSRTDPEMFRHLVPCDPVVTVAPDTVFFECFSKDESAYGCLLVDRDALSAQESGLGTTNVDYSLALYEHFQTLRSYRPTRLAVDPSGFEVKVEGAEDYREEKIDLPPSWLRGFGQLQAAMTLPSRRVDLPVEAVYSILAHLKRNREKTGPRSIRFVLAPGKPVSLVLDPWGTVIPCHGPIIEDDYLASTAPSSLGPYRSAPSRAGRGATEEIKVWGRRRLFSLARVLPLASRVEVRLLGSGLPSIWIAHMGDMRLVLALSGWTSNDWTSSVGLELLTGTSQVDARVKAAVLRSLATNHIATVGALAEGVSAPGGLVLSSLHELAKEGQVIYDFAGDVFRYRQVMPVALSEAVIGPEHPEMSEGKKLAKAKSVTVVRQEAMSGSGGRVLYVFKAGGTSAEAIIDVDGAIKNAKCGCSFFFKNRLRAGPCRHLVALKLFVVDSPSPSYEPPPVAAPSPKASPPPASKASPAPAPPSPPAPPRAHEGARHREIVSITADVLADMKSRAKAEDRSLSEVMELAWDIAFERIVEAGSWRAALNLCDPAKIKLIEFRSVEDPRQQELVLHADVLREAERLAEDYKASTSAVLNLAWLVARRRRA